MTNECVICELEELLDIAEDENFALREELEDTKADLIDALKRIISDADDYIADLEDYVDELEDELMFADEFEEFDEELDFCCCCGEPL